MSMAADAFVSQMAAAEPWPENAILFQPLKGEQILLSDNASCLAVQAFLRMCNLPVQVICRANAEYMSPSAVKEEKKYKHAYILQRPLF